MRPKFLLDAHISPLVAEIPSKQAIEADAAAASALAEASDEEILTLAAVQGRIVVTYDTKTIPMHYARLLEKGVKVPGLALVKSKSIRQSDVSGLARAIQKLAAQIEGGADPLGIYFLA